MEETMTAVSETSGNSPNSPKQQAKDVQYSPAQPRRHKRVALACQRCKQRKQRSFKTWADLARKCDGSQPSCSSCVRLKAQCVYVSPTNYKPRTAKTYITALENRVAQLETSLATRGNSKAGHDHWSQPQDDQGDDDIDPLLSTVRDISLDTGGSFVGSTSSITLARVLGSVIGIQSKTSPSWTETMIEAAQEPSRLPLSELEAGWYTSSVSGKPAVSLTGNDEVAAKLVETFAKFVLPRFPVLHPIYLRGLYEKRAELVEPYHRAVLHLVYALAGVWLIEARGENAEHPSDDHLEAALQYRDVVVGLGDARTVTYLLLLAQYSVLTLRVPKKLGTWTLVGLAMRLCVELGFHRRKRIKSPTVKSEIEKRLFWSCYYLDRELSVSLGRPTSIADYDIDVELPLDVDDSTQDVEVFHLAMEKDQTIPANPPTVLTYFIHLIRLKRIQSDIQTTLYRVDAIPNAIESERATDRFLEKLVAWKETIPRVGSWNALEEPQFSAYHVDIFIISYHRCVQLLLQPQLYATIVNDRYFELCMDASKGVCEGYRSIYHGMPMAFSSLSLQTVFIAGLTMVYGLWYKNSTVAVMQNFNALNDCSILLYVMSERWSASTKYRDAYESIKRSVIDRISEGVNRPRRTVTSMPPDLRVTLQNMDVGMADSTRDALEQMIAGITGEQLEFSGPQPQLDSSSSTGLFEWSWDTAAGTEGSSMNFDLGFSPFHEDAEL